jgi:hypothetical protein
VNRILSIALSMPVRLGRRFSRFRTNRQRAGSHCTPNEEPRALRPGPRISPLRRQQHPHPHKHGPTRTVESAPHPCQPYQAGAAKPRCNHIRMLCRRSESWGDASRASTVRSLRCLLNASTTGSVRTGLQPIQWVRRSASRSGRRLQPAPSLGRDCEFAAKPGSSPSA